MALIKCEECNKEISDKAGACPNCGYPVKINNDIICEECGYKLSSIDKSCPNCGCPIDSEEKESDELTSIQSLESDKQQNIKSLLGWATAFKIIGIIYGCIILLISLVSAGGIGGFSAIVGLFMAAFEIAMFYFISIIIQNQAYKLETLCRIEDNTKK